MRNLFETDVYMETVDRINTLRPESKAKWGKMNVAQMMAHCAVAFQVPLSEKKLPSIFLGKILGPFLKSKLYNDDPWKRNLPTAPNFRITNERNFVEEKRNLVEMVNQFYKAGPENISKHPHPFFGKFTPDQWGMSMYKHLDHHLDQFGV